MQTHTTMLKTIIRTLTAAIMMLTITSDIYAWEGMAMPRLRVDGRNLKDENGNIVKLHGYAQTFSPWFNERGTRWNNYDVEGCLKYNQQIIDRIMAAGWKMNFVRMHMDPYWSNIPGRRVKGENDISAFDFGRFEKYLDEVFVPMAEYAIAKRHVRCNASSRSLPRKDCCRRRISEIPAESMAPRCPAHHPQKPPEHNVRTCQ